MDDQTLLVKQRGSTADRKANSERFCGSFYASYKKIVLISPGTNYLLFREAYLILFSVWCEYACLYVWAHIICGYVHVEA